MNYYPHHIGDYAASTAHLSWLQDMAYTRLMRLYYQSEKPIPADVSRACILVRATSKAERQAVADVLQEFFVLAEDGYRQHRCDEEISKANETTTENEAKRANERERQRRHRERRKAIFEALRVHDIVPAWDTSLEQLESMLSRAQGRDCNAPVTRDSPVTNTDLRRLTNNQYPITNNQEPKEKPKTKAPPPAAFAVPEWVPVEAWEGWLATRKGKRAPNSPHALTLAVQELAKLQEEGHDPLAVLHQSTMRGWTGLFPLRKDGHGGQVVSMIPGERL